MKKFCAFFRAVLGIPDRPRRPYHYGTNQVKSAVQQELLLFNKQLKFMRFYKVYELAICQNGMLLVNLGKQIPVEFTPSDAPTNEFEEDEGNELVMITEDATPHSIRLQIASHLSTVLKEKVHPSDIYLRFDYDPEGGRCNA